MASHLTLRLFENEIYEQSCELYHIANFTAALVKLFPAVHYSTQKGSLGGGGGWKPVAPVDLEASPLTGGREEWWSLC